MITYFDYFVDYTILENKYRSSSYERDRIKNEKELEIYYEKINLFIQALKSFS